MNDYFDHRRMVSSIVASYFSFFYHCESLVRSKLMFSSGAIGAGTGRFISLGRFGAWISALGLAICLTGCQPRVNKAPALPPPLPPAAPLSQPVRPTLYVKVKRLNLRACPGIDCPKIAVLESNTEVEKLGEIENWTQLKVKKDGTIGYVSSRYLSPQPTEVAQSTKKKPRKARSRKFTRSPKAAGEKGKAGLKKQVSSFPLPRVM
jgi:hypothetical protein